MCVLCKSPHRTCVLKTEREQIRRWGFRIESFLGLHLIYHLTYWSIFHFYFNNHTSQWKLSFWFFVISASPAPCLALCFLWITWLNLMYWLDRHLAEWHLEERSKKGLGEKAAPRKASWAQRCPERACVSSSGPGTPHSQGFLPFLKHSPPFSTSWLLKHISSNQTAILWFLPVQILPILQGQIQNAPSSMTPSFLSPAHPQRGMILPFSHEGL